jgi:hypothetical protein
VTAVGSTSPAARNPYYNFAEICKMQTNKWKSPYLH